MSTDHETGGALSSQHGWGSWHTSAVMPLVKAEPDWEQIDAKIRAGQRIDEIVQELKGRESLATVNPRTIRRSLYRYKASLPPDVILGGVWATKADVILRAANLLERGLDDLVEMERLYKQQTYRLRLGRSIENRTKMPLEGVRREMELALEMRKVILLAKQSLGFLPKRPTQIQEMGTHGEDGLAAHTLAAEVSPVEGVHVLDTLKKIKHMLKPALEPNGTLR